MSDRLKALAAEGTSPWLDNIRRGWLNDGTFAAMVDDGIVGVTSNPTIFQKAIADSDDYDAAIEHLHGQRQAAGRGVLRAGDRGRPGRRRPAARRVRRDRAPGRVRLVRAAPGPGQRRRGLDHGGAPVLRPHRPPQHLHQDPGHGRGRAGDRGVDRSRRERQRHAALLAGCLRGDPRGVPARSRASRRGRPADRRRALGGQLLRLARRHGGRQAAGRRARRCAAGPPSPTPSSRTSSSWRSPAASAGRRSPATAPACSGRCGRPRAPRTRTTRTCSTSTS